MYIILLELNSTPTQETSNVHLSGRVLFLTSVSPLHRSALSFSLFLSLSLSSILTVFLSLSLVLNSLFFLVSLSLSLSLAQQQQRRCRRIHCPRGSCLSLYSGLSLSLSPPPYCPLSLLPLSISLSILTRILSLPACLSFSFFGSGTTRKIQNASIVPRPIV